MTPDQARFKTWFRSMPAPRQQALLDVVNGRSSAWRGDLIEPKTGQQAVVMWFMTPEVADLVEEFLTLGESL